MIYDKTIEIESNFDKLENRLITNNSKLVPSHYNGKPVIYMLKTLYKINGRFKFGIIQSAKANIKVAITSESLKELIDRGYIANAMLTNSNVIKKHKHKIKAEGLYEFKVYNVKSDKQIKDLYINLAKTYGSIVHLTTCFKNISEQRLSVERILFDLSGNVAALDLKNAFESYRVSLNKFLIWSGRQYNMGRFSPRSESENFTRVLSYIYLDKDKCRKLIGEQYEKVLSKYPKYDCGDCYKISVSMLDYDLALLYYKTIDNKSTDYISKYRLGYILPKPETFESLTLFKQAITDSNADINTYYTNEKYDVVSYIPRSLRITRETLYSHYTELCSGTYLKQYSGIDRWLDYQIKLDEDKYEAEVKDKLIAMARRKESGENIDKEFSELGILFIRQDLPVDKYGDIISIAEHLMSDDVSQEYKDAVTYSPSFEEALEFEGIEFNSKEFIKSCCTIEKSSSDSSQDNELLKFNRIGGTIAVAYLNTDCTSKIELVRNTNDVYLRLINEDTNDYVIITDSVISYSDYINKGIDIKLVREPIKRALNSLYKPKTMLEIIEELNLYINNTEHD